MPLLQLIVLIIVVALVWWIFSTYVLPHVPEPFRTVIIVLLAVVACYWLLSIVGLVPPVRFT